MMIIIITLWLCTPGPRVVPSQAGQPCEQPLENQKQAWPLCPAEEGYNLSSFLSSYSPVSVLLKKGPGMGHQTPSLGLLTAGTVAGTWTNEG